MVHPNPTRSSYPLYYPKVARPGNFTPLHARSNLMYDSVHYIDLRTPNVENMERVCAKYPFNRLYLSVFNNLVSTPECTHTKLRRPCSELVICLKQLFN